MAFLGANTEQLRNLGTQLQTGSNEIEKQNSMLTRMLDGTDWKGPDADRFRNEWKSNHATALAKVAQALEEAGKHASRNAQQQEDASRG